MLLLKFALFSAGIGAALAITPVQKVVDLLAKLSEQLGEEGKEEAKSYDKFACFCKEQASDKQYAIEKSSEKIDKLEASVASLTAEIGQLDEDVIALKQSIDTEEDAAKEAARVRQGNFETYEIKRVDLVGGVDAVGKALEHMRSSKDSSANAAKASALVQRFIGHLHEPHRASRRSFLGRQTPTKYAYQSNDIIGTLQELQKTFKANLAAHDEAEAKDKHAHDMTEGARAAKVASLKASKDKKEALSSKKSEEKSEKAKLSATETEDKTADESFLAQLTTTCEEKAQAWDRRSAARADELSAIAQASEKLKGMGDLYKVNSKLTGLMAKQQTSKASTRVRASLKVPTLVQVAAHVHRHGGIKSVLSFLDFQASSLHSGSLARAAEALRGSGATGGVDHFAKVRGIIEDLVARLEAEATDEATAKGLCDTQMSEATQKRDERAGEIEGLGANIDKTKSEITELDGSITTLSAEVADVHKALGELTELRTKEKADFEKAIADASAGQKAVGEAITLLHSFYDAALLQYTPPNSDREGKTVGDLSPGVGFDGEYRGSDSSKGIIGLLEVIEADFERTATTLAANEDAAAADFTKQKNAMETEIQEKETSKDEMSAELSDKDASLIGFEDSHKDAHSLHESALDELEKLKASCVDASESFEQRKKKREEEIEALKQAMNILENWKS